MRAALQDLCARCNAQALHVLREGLAHIEAGPEAGLPLDDPYLRALNEHNRQEEELLTAEALALYREVAPPGRSTEALGGFARSWTHAARAS